MFDAFNFFKGYMPRLVYVKNKAHGHALLSVVACALFVALAIVVNLRPLAGPGFLGMRYPFRRVSRDHSLPSLRNPLALAGNQTRLATLRMQVSDGGPLL